MEYGLIGEKLNHSFSKEIHGLIADYQYHLKEIPQNELSDFLTKRHFSGVNVTIPYKQAVIPYIDVLSEHAKEIGAVNTIVNLNGKLYGYNTDYYGAKEMISRFNIPVYGKKIAILGSGGTALTFKALLKDLGAKDILVVSRTAKNGCMTYGQLLENPNDIEMIINTTPVGTYPNYTEQPVDLTPFKKLCGVIDVVYNPIKTQLILQAERLNIPCCGGLYMLVAQAVYASQLMRNTQIDLTLIEKVYNDILNRKINIVLTGMPTCGKSTVAGILANKLNRPLYDTDKLIVDRICKDIPTIFKEFGVEYFRELERQIIRELSTLNGVIIATGGGAILNEENVQSLKNNGRIFFIDRPLEKLTATADRPLSCTEDSLNNMYLERYPIYKNTADFTIFADGDAVTVANNILRKINYEDFNC